MAISSTSFTKTPQAGDDIYNLTEDQLMAMGYTGSTVKLDVMSNDLGGNAKQLFSIDDGNGNALNPTDLLQADGLTNGVSAWQLTANGNLVRINNGKIEIDVSSSLTASGASGGIDSLGADDVIQDSFVYAIRLGNGTLSWATVRVNITGNNDAATITASENEDTNVVEAGGAGNSTAGDAMASGTLTVHDVDGGENHFAAVPASSLSGPYGDFSFNSATGAWTFTLDQGKADALTAGQQVIQSLNVQSADGTANQTITVNITGSNDAAVITGSSTAALNETNAAQSTGGNLDATDVDSSAAFVEQSGVAGSNGYGSFSIDASGAWTYTMNDAHDEFVGGVDYTDSLTVATADGTEQVLTVTMTGSNDAAVITGSSTAALNETNAAQSTGGNLDATDVDSSAAFVEQSGVAGSNGYGSFSIDASGAWTYTMNDAHDEFVAGTNYTDSIDVATTDGTQQVITVTITGTADGPVAAPPVYTGPAADPNDFDLVGPGPAASFTQPSGGALNGPNTLVGTNSAESINGGQGNDTLYGYGGNDTLNGGQDTDLIYGGSGNDGIQGDSQTDLIYGGSGNDTIAAGADVDTVYGGSGNDVISGNADADILVGGFGADTLSGNAGSDTFKFLDTRDTGDTITNFSGTGIGADGDKIDLSAIDSNTGTGANDSFVYGGNTTTLSAYSLIWFLSDNGTAALGDDFTVVQVDTDGNVATAELQLQITATTPLVSGDFLL
jgi:VCBS repeat-containing protein